jgi:hypothetical protein
MLFNRMEERFFSHVGQDVKVLRHYNKKRNGYFVEIGAYNGIQFSNTYLLEKEYGWKGICVEPLPDEYFQLVINRPNSYCCSFPIYSESDQTVVFDKIVDFTMLSGISHCMDRCKNAVNKNKVSWTTNTLSLNDLLKEANAPRYIEYLSLETNGSEYEILKTVDFDTYVFGIIDVEHNYIEPRRSNIRQLLKKHGYRFEYANDFDDHYVYVG